MSPQPESLASARLWLAFAIMMLVGGIGNSFPVFFPPLLADFGGSRTATAFAVTLLWIGGAVLGPVAGYLVSRGDPRRLVTVGLAVTAAGLVVGALAPSLRVFTLALGVGAGIGVGLTGMVTQAAVIADTYARHRGFATGIAFSGSMAGYVLAIPAHWAITAVGWRGALVAWSAVVVGLIPAVWWVYPARLGLRRTVEDGGARGRAREPVGATVCSVPFAALALLFTIAPFAGYLATTQHGAGPFLSGLIYDTTESYRAIYVTAVAVVVLAMAALLVFVRTTPRPPGAST